MFVPRQIYRRRDLHHQFGGQQQGGVSTPARFPIILLFRGEWHTTRLSRRMAGERSFFLYRGRPARGHAVCSGESCNQRPLEQRKGSRCCALNESGFSLRF